MFRPKLDLDQEFPSLSASPSPPPPSTSTNNDILLSSTAQQYYPKTYAAASSTNQHGYYAGDPSRKFTRHDFPALSSSSSTNNNNFNSGNTSMVSPWNNGYPSSILEQQQQHQDSNESVKHGGSKSNEQPWLSRSGNTLKLTQPMQPPMLRTPPASSTTSTSTSAPASTSSFTTASAVEGKSSQQAQRQAPSSTNATDKSTHHSGYYGLLGLIDVIQKKNADKSMLGIGTDLDTLGLDLNARDEIYPSFLSPWQETNIQSKISFQTNNAIQYGYYLSASYRAVSNNAPPPAIFKMHQFKDDILFYTFYCMTRDELQDAAAQELYHRNWRYHKELGLWITREEEGKVFEPPSGPHDIEQGEFVFFDTATWRKKKKEWTICWDAMEVKREKTSSSYASSSASVISSPAAASTSTL